MFPPHFLFDGSLTQAGPEETQEEEMNVKREKTYTHIHTKSKKNPVSELNW